MVYYEGGESMGAFTSVLKGIIPKVVNKVKSLFKTVKKDKPKKAVKSKRKAVSPKEKVIAQKQKAISKKQSSQKTVKGVKGKQKFQKSTKGKR